MTLLASRCPGPLVLLVVAAGALPIGAPAQCSNPWLALPSTAGVLGATRTVRAAVVWDRDGAGPLPALTVIGGDFTIAGSVNANRIAAFDPTTNAWSALGLGLGGEVWSLQPLPNGDLVAGGALGIARFDGTNWLPLGAGIPNSVAALALLPNGDLVAGGDFTTAGGVPASHIARWNGTSWAPLGAGMTGSFARVSALALLPNGDLVAGGWFTTAGGIAASNIARWDGTTWAAMGSGLDNSVTFVLTRSNGDLVAGGSFIYSGTGGAWLNHVARWDGATWSAIGSGLSGSPWAAAELANGNLVVGSFQSQSLVQLWNGTTWAPMNVNDTGTVRALTTLPNGDLVAGGNFLSIGGIDAGGVARWNGAAWSAIGSGLTGSVSQVMELGDGSVVGIGNFTFGTSRLALWSGGQWLPFPGPLAGVTCIQRLPNGNLLAAGTSSLAQWNGTSWSTYAPGFAGITDIAVLPNGHVAACGTFPQQLAVWNGAAWTSLGPLGAPLGLSTMVNALAVTASGELVVAGRFTSVGGVSASNIARWNGTTWSPFGFGLQVSSFGYVTALCTMPNGDLVAGGWLQGAYPLPVQGIARWNGTAWSPLGSGLSHAPEVLLGLQNGDLVAGGNFPTGITRWNGASWWGFGSGADGAVYALAQRANGGLLVGGSFHTVDGMLSPFFAEITTTCPATAVVSGPGCTGSGGPNVLTATTRPWLGSTFRAQATGLPPLSFALIANGVLPISLPLSALLPQGLPGCMAWVLADVIEVALPAAGAVTTQVVVPNAASLVGATFHQQVLPFVFDLSGNLIELTSTNALTMTLGAF